jgi:hypothetical protein
MADAVRGADERERQRRRKRIRVRVNGGRDGVLFLRFSLSAVGSGYTAKIGR